jgi:hypothetical protein
VEVDGHFVWLETVERRQVWNGDEIGNPYHMEYRAPERKPT